MGRCMAMAAEGIEQLKSIAMELQSYGVPNDNIRMRWEYLHEHNLCVSLMDIVVDVVCLCVCGGVFETVREKWERDTKMLNRKKTQVSPKLIDQQHFRSTEVHGRDPDSCRGNFSKKEPWKHRLGGTYQELCWCHGMDQSAEGEPHIQIALCFSFFSELCCLCCSEGERFIQITWIYACSISPHEWKKSPRKRYFMCLPTAQTTLRL